MEYLNFLKIAIQTIIHAKIGIGTIFMPQNDQWNPNPNLACLHRNMRWSDMVVAHPTLPCKSTVLLYNPRTEKYITAIVGDRGPKNALVDLSPAVAKAISHNGYENVVLMPLKRL